MEEGRVVTGHLVAACLMLLFLFLPAGNLSAFELRLVSDLPEATPATPATPAADSAPVPANSFFALYLISAAALLAIFFGWWAGGQPRNREVFRPAQEIGAARLPVFQGRPGQQGSEPLHTETVRMKLPKRAVAKRRRRSSEPPVEYEDHLACAEKAFRAGKLDESFEHIRKGLEQEPYHMDIYRLALRVYEASSPPSPELVRLLKTGIHLIWKRHPMLWWRLTEDGRRHAPDLVDWDTEPSISRE